MVQTVIDYYRSHEAEIELAQVEGLWRQIIGWREYMRGIYWKEMPHYAEKNALDNHNPSPISMDRGNENELPASRHQQFVRQCLCPPHSAFNDNWELRPLAQVHPDAVDQWYLGIYADAIEWVQITNTRGMSQWADGGIVATKPYVSAAAYIHKMSNYCDSCVYDKKKRLGEDACPFNSLYWNFLDDKKQFFAKNNRMAMMLRLLEKIPPQELAEIKARAGKILTQPDAF